MKYMRKLLRDRRGIAMEMAMMVMVVTIALGTLMVTVALMQDNSTRSITRRFDEKLELEQIGEDFCAHVVNKNEMPSYEDYDVSVSEDGDASTLTVKKKGGGDVLMTVSVKSDSGKYEIVQWEIN